MADILLADSGSSKTDWVLVGDGEEKFRFQSVGLNPYFLSPGRITEEIVKALPEGFDVSLPDEVLFYGSGCSAAERIDEVAGAIKGAFPYAMVSVESDLVGAARALFGSDPGLVAILGTGSNVCLYSGTTITHGIRSLGFLFGDWGSGAVIGRELVTSYLRRRMPTALSGIFEEWHQLSFEQMLEGSYRTDRPSRFLASFVPFLAQQKQHEWVQSLLRRSFDDFFSFMVADLPHQNRYPFGAVGSVAFYFREFLEASAAKAGFYHTRVLAAPMEGLVELYKHHQ